MAEKKKTDGAKGKKNAEERFDPPLIDRRDVMMNSAPSQIWLISFTDVIALMLTFFVLMFSMINPEREIYSNITYVLQDNKQVASAYNMGRQSTDANQRLEIIRGEDLNYLASVLRQNIKGRGELYGAEIINEGNRLIIRLPNQLLFDSGSYDLKQTSRAPMSDLFVMLKTLKNAIEIYGYTDPSPVTQNTDAYRSNYGLAQQRAASVAKLIYETGYRRPVGLYGIESSAENANDFAMQRRVDIVIHENRGILF